MTSYYILRLQIAPHLDPHVAAEQLLRLAAAARMDEIAVFFFGEEINDGHDRPDRIRRWIEHSRVYRNVLAAAGVKISLNAEHSLLHRDRGRVLKSDQPWRTMMDAHGRAAEAVVCPLDPQWRAYHRAAMRLYAREGFRVIWIDDDIRYHNHDPLDWGGCFCPLHVAEFNRRAGVHATRDEIVAKCTAPGPPHPWRELWLDMWEDLHLEMISQWREIVEAGGSRLGLMSSSPEAHAAEGRRWENWWKALAGDEPPIQRPHYWGYGESPGGALYNSIALLDQNRRLQPAGTESGPEVECFPFGPWNKPFRQIAAQMSLAHILGSTNLSISIYDLMGNDPQDDPTTAAFLAQWRPVCDWLADEFPMTLRPVGVGLPWSQDMGRRIHTDGSGNWRALTCPSRGWALWLGSAGHAFSMRPSPALNALAGPVVWSCSDQQLRQWLAGGLLLDGDAAAILVERGFGELIGVRNYRFIRHGEVLYSIERCTDADFALREGAQMSVNGWDYCARLFQAEFAADVRIASELRSPLQQVVGHGLALYDNQLGGRVAIVPWCAGESVEALVMNTQRAAQLTQTLNYLDPANTRGWAEGGAWLAPQFLTDGEIARGVVWNAGGDAVHEITIHPPRGMTFTVATQVTAEAERLPAQLTGDRITFTQPLHQWEFVVLK